MIDNDFICHRKTPNTSSSNVNSIVAAKPPTPTMQSPVHSSVNPVEVENLKKQLKSSELTISELKTIVEKLAIENSMLKTRIDSQVISPDVQLWVINCWLIIHSVLMRYIVEGSTIHQKKLWMKSNQFSTRNRQLLTVSSDPFPCTKLVKFLAMKIDRQSLKACTPSAHHRRRLRPQISRCLWSKKSPSALKSWRDAFKNCGLPCRISQRKKHLCHALSAYAWVSQNWLPFFPQAWLMTFWRMHYDSWTWIQMPFKPSAQIFIVHWTAKIHRTLSFIYSRFAIALTT